MPESIEHKAAKQITTALDRNSFQGWAFAAVMNAQSPEVQMRFMRLFLDMMDTWIARDEHGLSNYPQHVKLAEYSRAMKKALDSLPPF